MGQIELRLDISEDEEEERRRPGIDALESAVHEEALEERKRKGMIGQIDLPTKEGRSFPTKKLKDSLLVFVFLAMAAKLVQ